jgi:hydrogenase nickel incorporation protein HypA/HybF
MKGPASKGSVSYCGYEEISRGEGNRQKSVDMTIRQIRRSGSFDFDDLVQRNHRIINHSLFFFEKRLLFRFCIIILIQRGIFSIPLFYSIREVRTLHELSLVQALLDMVEEQAEKHGFNKVQSLKLSFGQLSSIEPSSLRFAFEILSAGTRAAGALLDFDIRPIVVRCLSCQATERSEMLVLRCSQCGAEVSLTSGMETLQLLEMDVDEE